MRALRLSLVLFVLLLTTFSIADAQAEPSRIGGTLPGEIAWSPDGAHLLVAASDMSRLYRTGQWDAPLRAFPAALKASWVNMRVVELDGQRFEVRTGRAVATPDAAPQNPTPPVYNRLDYPSQKYTVATTSNITLQLTDIQNPDAPVIELPVNDNGTVLLMIFSPDSSKLAVLYQDWSDTRQRLQLWDIEAQNRLFEVRAISGSKFYEVRFSEDGRSLLAFETLDGYYGPYGDFPTNEFINIWDTATGGLRYRVSGSFNHPEFGAEGWLAYIVYPDSWNPELAVWNGNELLYTGFTPARDAYFSEDGHMLFSVSQDNVAVFNIDFDQRSVEQAGSTSFYSDPVVFSDDGSILLTKSPTSPGSALWHTQPMTLIASFDSDSRLRDVAFSPDNSRFAVEHKTFWDARSGEQLREFDTPVQIAPDWSWVSYWDGGVLIIHNLNTGTEIRHALVEPEIGRAVGVDPLERWVFFWEGIRLTAYSLSDGERALSLLDVRGGRVVFAADGSFIVVSEYSDYGWRLHHLTGLTIDPEGLATLSVTSPDGRFAATYQREYYDPSLVKWLSVGTEEVVGQWIANFGNIQGISYHPTENWLAVDVTRQRTWMPVVEGLSQPSEVYLIDTEQTDTQSQTAVVKLMTINEQGSSVNPSFSPAGRFLILSCGADCVEIIDLHDLPESGSLLQPITRRFGASALAYDEGESMIFSKNPRKDEASLHVWDTEGEPLIFPAVGKAIALNADSTRAATVTADGIALWDVDAVRAGDLTPMAVYPVTGLAPTQLTFDADDRLIALEPSGVTIYAPPAPTNP